AAPGSRWGSRSSRSRLLRRGKGTGRRRLATRSTRRRLRDSRGTAKRRTCSSLLPLLLHTARRPTRTTHLLRHKATHPTTTTTSSSSHLLRRKATGRTRRTSSTLLPLMATERTRRTSSFPRLLLLLLMAMDRTRLLMDTNRCNARRLINHASAVLHSVISIVFSPCNMCISCTLYL
uniref:Uncharacterized protein n=1 Tax=Aegilops tauschii subsp. strangulata TaxID=200361 RepID=A0A452Z6Z4_AEGTS